MDIEADMVDLREQLVKEKNIARDEQARLKEEKVFYSLKMVLTFILKRLNFKSF